MNTTQTELLTLTKKLLDAITQKDWNTYTQLCDVNLTAFEPEACGQRITGLAFHQFYFQLGGGSRPGQVSIVQPDVKLLGTDAAVVSYVRLVQNVEAEGPQTAAFEETRVWQKIDGQWKHVHFHRSAIAIK